MRERWQTIVAVDTNAMVLLAGLLHRVHVHHGNVQVAQLVHEAVVDLSGYGMCLAYRQSWVHSDVDFGAQPVPEPPGPHLRYILNASNAAPRVPYLVYHRRVHPVQEPSEHHLPRLPDDHEYRRGDDEPHDGIGKRVAEPHPGGPEQHGKACPTVGPGVVAVSHKRRAAYLSTHPDAKDGHRLVADEAKQRGHRHRAQELDGARVDEPLYCLVA